MRGFDSLQVYFLLFIILIKSCLASGDGCIELVSVNGLSACTGVEQIVCVAASMLCTGEFGQRGVSSLADMVQLYHLTGGKIYRGMACLRSCKSSAR